MPRKCYYYKCSNNRLCRPEVSLFCFPRNSDIRDIWIRNSGNVNLFKYIGKPGTLNRNWGICELHFKRIHIIQTNSRKILSRHADAVPYKCATGPVMEDNSFAFGRVEIEEVKQEICDTLHSAEDTVDHIKTEEMEAVEVKIESPKPAIETTQGTGEFHYNIDADVSERVKIEEVKQECDTLHSDEYTVDHIKTEEMEAAEVKIETSKPAIETTKGTKELCCSSNASADSDVVLERVKIEGLKQESCDTLHLAEEHIKTEEGEAVEVKTETSKPTILTTKCSEEFHYDSDATTDSDVVLERMMNEQFQMENQSIVESNNEPVELKVGMTEPEDGDDLQLTEEFNIKDQNETSSDVLPESSTGKKIQEEKHLSSGLCISSIEDPGKLDKNTVDNRATDGKSLKNTKYEGSAHSFSTQNNISSPEITLDDLITETHSNSSTEIYKCANCTYKTTVEKYFDSHILKHCGETSNLKLYTDTCVHCYMTFRSKYDLDVHTVRRHPEFIGSVSCMIYECTICSFKTAKKFDFDKHMFRHASGFESKTCKYCSIQFGDIKTTDEHIISKHPNFIWSISSEVYGCTLCTFNTVYKPKLDTHMISMHPGTCGGYEISKCVYCNMSFNRKIEMNEHILRKHPTFILSISSEIYECMNCKYKTTMKHKLARHMLQHFRMPDRTCIRCNLTFVSKKSLDNHILKKHPSLIAFVTAKINSCEHCTYKTTCNRDLIKHRWVHSETLKACMFCEAKFKRVEYLNSHIIKAHPDFIKTVTCKIFECTKCLFKTTSKAYLKTHSSVHSDTSNSCVHCGEIYRSKRVLYDHILREHPNFTSTIPIEIYECTKCPFKTALKNKLVSHMLKHSGVASGFKFKKCIECNATFHSKLSLDDHIIKKHPSLIGSVTSKINECPFCTFKTTKITNLFAHLGKHREAADNFRISTCKGCNKKFHFKVNLDDHILRKHPKLISNISSKIYECANCSYKTTLKYMLTSHMTTHRKKRSRKVESSEVD